MKSLGLFTILVSILFVSFVSFRETDIRNPLNTQTADEKKFANAYEIVANESYLLFVRSVNTALSNGYTLAGGVSVVTVGNKTTYYQAVYKQ
jgi:hypothetical protein